MMLALFVPKSQYQSYVVLKQPTYEASKESNIESYVSRYVKAFHASSMTTSWTWLSNVTDNASAHYASKPTG
jgi:hypothetical protein